MDLSIINENIERLILIRRDADSNEQKRINNQLDKLYEFKYSLIKGEE